MWSTPAATNSPRGDTARTGLASSSEGVGLNSIGVPLYPENIGQQTFGPGDREGLGQLGLGPLVRGLKPPDLGRRGEPYRRVGARPFLLEST
jgi:hypothetical protein